jgi:nicotinamidase-related amidase
MKSALLVIDVQNEYFTGARIVTYPPSSLDNILQAMRAAHDNGVPVVLVQHASLNPQATAFRKDSPGWELHPAVAALPHDAVVHKNYPGSFTKTTLAEWLGVRKIEKVVICGYMTQMCCDTTARQAFHRGYTIDFLSDATGTLDQNNTAGAVSAETLHKTVLVVQQSAFSRVLSTAEWIVELGKPFAEA